MNKTSLLLPAVATTAVLF